MAAGITTTQIKQNHLVPMDLSKATPDGFTVNERGEWIQ